MPTDIPPTAADAGEEPFDPVILAGKYALGVLEGDELSDARQRMLAEPKFASDVEWWSWRLDTLAELAGNSPPSDAVWNAISARIDSEDSSATVSEIAKPPSRFPAGWSIGSALAGAAAAAVALYIAVPEMRQDAGPEVQQPQVAAQQTQLFAQLSDADTGRSVATRIDQTTGQLNLKIAGLIPQDTGTTATELWVVPVGGAPQSLGLIPGEGGFTRTLDADEKQLLVEGATLAVTFESREGAPHSAPSTPILLAGQLTGV